MRCNHIFTSLILGLLISLQVACSPTSNGGGSLGYSDTSVEDTPAPAPLTNIACPGAVPVIAVGTEIEDVLIYASEVHCYQFEGQKDVPYKLTLTTLIGDADLGLFSSENMDASSMIEISANELLVPDVIDITPTNTTSLYIAIQGFTGGMYNFLIDSNPLEAVVNAEIIGARGASIFLDGSESTDGGGGSLTYDWTLLSAPPGSTLAWEPESDPVVSFDADEYGDYVFQLVISNSVGDSPAVTTTVSVQHDFHALSYRVIDAEYSEALESIIMVSSDPSALQVFDTLLNTSVTIALPLVPTSVSVSPDGLFAAVGHNGWVSYIDLSGQALLKTVAVTTDVFDIVLAGNGYIYAFPRVDQWEEIHSLELATDIETLSSGYSIYAGTRARLHPNGMAMYGADNGLSPSDIEKYDISSGSASFLYDSPYHGDYAMCGNLWFSEDGLRIFTRCGHAFTASSSRSQDMLYNGSLENVPASSLIVSLSQSGEIGRVAVAFATYSFLPTTTLDTQIHFYNYEFLTEAEIIKMPVFPGAAASFESRIKNVFYNSDGSRYFAVVKADDTAGLLNEYAVISQP